MLSFCLSNFRGSNVGVDEGTDVSSITSRWVRYNGNKFHTDLLRHWNFIRGYIYRHTHTHTQQIYDVFHKTALVLLK
jgi:hypothetical protein